MINNTLAAMTRQLKGGIFGDSTTVMMALGPLRFGVSYAEYDSLKTSYLWRWAEKARYLRAPALQFHGAGSITKTMEITIVAETGADLGYLPSVRMAGDMGAPHRMIAGHSRPVGGAQVMAAGADMGLWCITALDMDESEFLRDGTAILYKATITIKSYGEDAHK